MDNERRRWLEHLAAACERVIAEQVDEHDFGVRAVVDDVEELLARLKAELAADQARS